MEIKNDVQLVTVITFIYCLCFIDKIQAVYIKRFIYTVCYWCLYRKTCVHTLKYINYKYGPNVLDV